jgi:hypothetical protein
VIATLSFCLRSMRSVVEIHVYPDRDSAEPVGFREERFANPALFFRGK